LEVNDVLYTINNRITKGTKHLKQAKFLLITLGTAYVYEEKSSRQVVANCHKVPNFNFNKKLLTKQEIIDSYTKTLVKIKDLNPDINIVFTLSPVRHIKDGVIENKRSKAILLTAIHELVEQNDNVSYFPSYEIMMDDLRDYRFYEKDMIHPNQVAIDYIWDKFSKVYFTDETKQLIKEVESLKKDLAHKPFNENSKEHQKFMNTIENKLEKFQLENPTVKAIT
jgi:hypothetical protein